MPKKRVLSVMIMAVLLVFLLCGCSSLLEKMEDADVRADTQQVVEALLANDTDSVDMLFSPIVSEDGYKENLAEACALLPDTDVYTLTLLSTRITPTGFSPITDERERIVSAVYELAAADTLYIVSVEQDTHWDVFSYFSVTPYEQTDYYSYGDLTNMVGADTLQWALLLSNLLWIAFVVILLIDCCRHKTRWKVLWILLILFGMGLFYLSRFPTSFNIGVNIGSFATYTALIRYGSGGSQLRLLFPIGAVVYLCLRKRLHRPKPTPPPFAAAPFQQPPLESTNQTKS